MHKVIDRNDLHIINQILQGNKKAFRVLYDKYGRLFMLICKRYFSSKQDSEDMLQEAFISIFRDLKQFDQERGQFQHWAKRVVINTCLQRIRKKTVLDDFDNLEDKQFDMGVSPDVLSTLSLQDLTSVIHKLPTGRRIVFNMYVIDGYTHKEISEQLGISVSTSKTQLMRAKKVLQSNIQNNNFAAFNGNYAWG